MLGREVTGEAGITSHLIHPVRPELVDELRTDPVGAHGMGVVTPDTRIGVGDGATNRTLASLDRHMPAERPLDLLQEAN